MSALKLGYQYGYWTADPRPASDLIASAQRAEALGYDSLWTGEAWSSDAFSPLAAVAGATSTVKLCTGIAQIGARPPTTAAMHAITLDGLSGGRPEHYIDGGFTYLLNNDTQLDIRAGQGLNPSADDFFAGVGFSRNSCGVASS